MQFTLSTRLEHVETMSKPDSYNAEEKVWSGRKVSPLFHPDASVGNVLEFVMKQHYSQVAQIFEPTGESWTFEKLHKTSMTIARNLAKFNLTQDDIIGIYASNTPYVAPLTIAAFLAGIPISTLDPSIDEAGVQRIYNITKPKVVFCDKAIYEMIDKAISELEFECHVFVLDEVKGSGTIGEFLQGSEDEVFQ